MLSVASVDIWQWTPFVYLVIFAGLQTVPHGIGRGSPGGWGRVVAHSSCTSSCQYLRPLLLLVLFFRIARRAACLRCTSTC